MMKPGKAGILMDMNNKKHINGPMTFLNSAEKSFKITQADKMPFKSSQGPAEI